MNKLTTKLLVSVLTVAFALVALGTTTFAWFTLSETATVSQFDAQLTAGEGIEISLDGITYYTTIPTEVITAKIAEQNVILKDLTSTNGVKLTKLDGTSVTWIEPTLVDGKFTSDPNQFIQFDLWVRSTANNTTVLVDEIQLTDSGTKWVSDAKFTNAKDVIVDANTEATYHASSALRMSFTLDKQTSANLVYEKPVSDDNTVLGQEASANGMVSYYLAKRGENLLEQQKLDENNEPVVDGEGKPEMVPYNPTLPATNTLTEIIEGKETKKPFNLTSLTTKTGNYYVQKMTIRLWVEGWDPDTFNAILDANVFVKIIFKSE